MFGYKIGISIHAPLTGSDRIIFYTEITTTISIHAPLTGSDDYFSMFGYKIGISIHAPLTGSDASEPNGVGTSNISIHAPLTGSDTIGCTLCQHFFIFQSTLPSQGATCASRICKNISCDFNPRSPHRERRTGRASMPTVHGISIHAPLTGSDHYRTWIYGFITKFQSTLPSQGATAFGGKVEF